MKSNDKCAVSVVIPVRNCQDYLKQSLESILNQVTEYPYEIIVVDDNSTDDSELIVKSLVESDSRIHYVKSEGYGIVDALNQGIALSSASFIIRHDADDLMEPWRIQTQIDFLSKNPCFAVVGGQIELFGNAENVKPTLYPESNTEIRRFLERGNPFAHPTVALNRKYLKKDPYDKAFQGAEDYRLWIDLLNVGKGQNLNLILTRYRVHSGQVTYAQKKKVDKVTIQVQHLLVKQYLKQAKIIPALRVCLFMSARYIRMLKIGRYEI